MDEPNSDATPRQLQGNSKATPTRNFFKKVGEKINEFHRLIILFSPWSMKSRCITKRTGHNYFMAYFHSSTFGTITGRHGTAVAAIDKDGNNVIRLYRKPFNPNTPKQQALRLKFGIVNKELAPLRQVITMGHKDSRAFSKIVGKAISGAITGEYPEFSIDFSKVSIASGTLQSVVGVTAKVAADSPDTLNFSWDTTLGFQSRLGADDDKVNIVCFDASLSMTIPFMEVATRKEGSAVVTLPEIWQGNDIHCWLYLSSADGMYNSGSVYTLPASL